MTFDLDLWLFDRMNIRKFPYYINKSNLVQIGLQLFKWGHFHIFSLSYNLTSDDLWSWYMIFDCMNIWRFPHYINKPSLVAIGLQLFKWVLDFHIFSLSYNLISDNLWPWYIIFDLINKWGSLCCMYDPTLVEIHQSMWKVEPLMLTYFHNNRQQTTTTVDKAIPICVFPAKAGDTKTGFLTHLNSKNVFIHHHSYN